MSHPRSWPAVGLRSRRDARSSDDGLDRPGRVRRRPESRCSAWSEVGKPAIGDDEVLVRVHAASVDRGTWHLMAGLPYPIRVAGFGLRKPKPGNPGRSLAGTVEAVGAGVTGFAPGDEVFGIGDGSFAEYASARAGQARAQAGEPLLRAGGRRPRLGAHRPAGRS